MHLPVMDAIGVTGAEMELSDYRTEMATFFCIWGANRASGIQSHWFSSWG